MEAPTSQLALVGLGLALIGGLGPGVLRYGRMHRANVTRMPRIGQPSGNEATGTSPSFAASLGNLFDAVGANSSRPNAAIDDLVAK